MRIHGLDLARSRPSRPSGSANIKRERRMRGHPSQASPSREPSRMGGAGGGVACEARSPLTRLLQSTQINTAAQLVALHGFEQGLEVALAEALVLLALDELEEHRADQGLGEDLQQQARIALVGPNGAGKSTLLLHLNGILHGRGKVSVAGLEVKAVADDLGASDQRSFLDAGVPAVQLFSGPHPDYHRASDSADKLDYPGLLKTAALLDEVVGYLAAAFFRKGEILALRGECDAAVDAFRESWRLSREYGPFRIFAALFWGALVGWIGVFACFVEREWRR